MIIYRIKKRIARVLLYLPLSMRMRVSALRFAGYEIGKKSLIGGHFVISDRTSDINNVLIGKRVSIGNNVTLVTTSWPNNSILHKIYPIKYARIIIEDDCWIGTGVIILPGVIIGKCSIVGAGVIVNHDIPPYTIIKHSKYETKKLNDFQIDRLNKD